MLKLQLLALRAFWRATLPLRLRFEWGWTWQCDGYAPIGDHLAQYCLRFSGHRGPCLAQIDANRAEGAAEFMPDKRDGIDYTGPYASCLECHRSIHLLRSPSGEWWAHDNHPLVPHDARPGDHWRICPQCGRYTRISHRTRWCQVDGQTDDAPHWCCSREDCDAMQVRRAEEMRKDQLAAIDPLLVETAQRYLQGVVPGGLDDEPVQCRCAVVNNPPCSNCEAGLVDPDRPVDR
jgi:hypothetical protein